MKNTSIKALVGLCSLAISLNLTACGGGGGSNEVCGELDDGTDVCGSVNADTYYTYGTVYETDNPTDLPSLYVDQEVATIECGEDATTSGGLVGLTCELSGETYYLVCGYGSIYASSDGSEYFDMGCNSVNLYCSADGMTYDSCDPSYYATTDIHTLRTQDVTDETAEFKEFYQEILDK